MEFETLARRTRRVDGERGFHGIRIVTDASRSRGAWQVICNCRSRRQGENDSMTHNSRVLLADADEQVRALLSRALLDRDVFCDAAVSARDALAQLGARRYALMLLHLEMPGADEVLNCIRSMPVNRRPIVLMTADVRSSKDAIDTEIVQIIIRRPLKIAEVAGMIRACLEFVPDA